LMKTYGYSNEINLQKIIDIINDTICPMAKNMKVKMFKNTQTNEKGILYIIPQQMLNCPNKEGVNFLERFYNQKIFRQKKVKRTKEVEIRTKSMITFVKMELKREKDITKKNTVIKIFEEFCFYMPSFCTKCNVSFLPEKEEIVFKPTCIEIDLRVVFKVCSRLKEFISVVMVNPGVPSITIVMRRRHLQKSSGYSEDNKRKSLKRKRIPEKGSRKKARYY